jgi:hypothetical protein
MVFAYRLCGANRLETRNVSGRTSPIRFTSIDRIRACTQVCAPEMTNVGSFNAVRMWGSVGRPDRIGPKYSVSLCCHRVRNRVIPSTTISKTTSACWMPD